MDGHTASIGKKSECRHWSCDDACMQWHERFPMSDRLTFCLTTCENIPIYLQLVCLTIQHYMICIPELEDHGGVKLALQAVVQCPLCTELLRPKRVLKPVKEEPKYLGTCCMLGACPRCSCTARYLVFADVASKLLDMLQCAGLGKLSCRGCQR